MKEHFPGFYSFDENEIGRLISSATIVFDVDVLLDLFRMKKEVVESLLSLMEDSHVKGRLWLPYDVAWLYHHAMNGEIIKQIDHINSALSHLTQCHDAITCFKKFPYLRQNHIDVLNRAIESIREVCNDQQAELTDALKSSPIKERMDTLFRNKIGPSYQDQELTSIYSDGEIRYPHSIPPGYARGSHTDKRICYHDLIVWKQMIKYSKEMERNNNRMDILLVTGNIRKDWYYIVKDQLVSPRHELINEFHQEAESRFCCISMRKFVEMSCSQFHITLSNHSEVLAHLTENVEYSSADANYVGSNSMQTMESDNTSV